jgi:uncharacterized protein YkwD
MSLTAPAKRPSHHKKVTGDHHRRSKHYLKAYHPYLPLLLLVLVGLAINIFWTSRTSVLGATTSMNGNELLADTNAVRHAYNQDDLKIDSRLSAAAQAKANDMATTGYWSHTAPNGTTPWKLIQNSGYDYYRAGENLAYGFRDSADTVDGWLNSSEHRANMLSPDFTDVGFGIAPVKNYQGHGPSTIVVAMYAEPTVMAGVPGISAASSDTLSDIPLRNVSRIQLLTHGDAPWSLMLTTALMLLAAAWFAYRHTKAWHAAWREGEEFVLEHKLLDVLIVAVAVAGFVLTRSAGFIH